MAQAQIVIAGVSHCYRPPSGRPVLALEEWDMSRPMARMVISPPQSQPMQPDIPNWTWHE